MNRSLPLVLLLGPLGCRPSPTDTHPHTWVYQLQNADPTQIAATAFDVVVMDYARDGTDATAYTPQEIQTLQASGKLVLAYLSIGEAETYRFYWDPSWD
ncbi:MAG: endo alpha-1,4 polygalactosaminidase, partial [Candidatus Hydrothermae bacterium]|nr:endo alpha-1,4 polygalactosaminidase [Candidatus Hydrothermae bacterium]